VVLPQNQRYLAAGHRPTTPKNGNVAVTRIVDRRPANT